MSKTRIIKGEAYILGDSLVQDQTVFREDGLVSESQAIIIENIWDDLMAERHQYKVGIRGNYFYWEVDQTDTEDGNVEVKVLIECPSPKIPKTEEDKLDLKSSKGEWPTYWFKRIETYENNYKKNYVIQPQTVVLSGSKYIMTDGTFREVKDEEVINTDFGDITNLMSHF